MAAVRPLTPEQKRAILVRLGWHPANAQRTGAQMLDAQLEHLHRANAHRVEFEVQRQHGRAWDHDEVRDLPPHNIVADTAGANQGHSPNQETEQH